MFGTQASEHRVSRIWTPVLRVVKVKRIAAVFAAVLVVGFAAALVVFRDRLTSGSSALPEQELLTGEQDLVIGVADGDERYLFGRVEGLALGPRDRIYVADALFGTVRVYSPAGDFLFMLGRRGEGPREFVQGPCGIAIDASGVLWMISPSWYMSSPRVFRARVGDREGVPDLEQIPVRNMRSMGCDVPAYDSTGILAVTQLFQDRTRVTVDTGTGEEVERVSIPGPEDMLALGWLTVPGMTVSGEQVDFLVEPPVYGSIPLVAFSADRRAAAAVSTMYDVQFYDAAGRETVSVVRDEIGPGLTREERDEVRAILDSTRVHFGHPYTEIPERKPPLRAMWFDRDGRLWLERHLENPRKRAADVYGKQGESLFRAEWPLDISLELGAIRGRTALGVQTDELGVHRVVRLSFDD